MSLLCMSEYSGRLEFKQSRKRSLQRVYHVVTVGGAFEVRSLGRTRQLRVLQRAFEKTADSLSTRRQIRLLSPPIVHPREQARFS
jgi:hypothetical protein